MIGLKRPTTLGEEVATAFAECNNVQFVTLIGSCAYGGWLSDWSDVDFIVGARSNHLNCVMDASRRLGSHLLDSYGVKITSVVLTPRQLAVMPTSDYGSNSVFLHAFSGRQHARIDVLGQARTIMIDRQVELHSCRNYVMDKLVDVQRLLVQGSINADSLARVIRWYSSILRASLRCGDVFCLPYENLLVAPQLGEELQAVASLRLLFGVRRRWPPTQEQAAGLFQCALDLLPWMLSTGERLTAEPVIAARI